MIAKKILFTLPIKLGQMGLLKGETLKNVVKNKCIISQGFSITERFFFDLTSIHFKV